MPRITENVEHQIATACGKRYLFTPKHHGGHPTAARWCEELSLEQEFQVFANASAAAACDDHGNHYGVSRIDAGGLLTIGTWGQQVAEFPSARADEPWHGYPLYPINEDGPEKWQGERMRPSKAVLKKLEKVELITGQERKRLMRGDPA